MMFIECELTPRAELTPRQYKHLGEQLGRWCDEQCASGTFQWIDEDALAELLRGERPQPVFVRKVQRHLGRTLRLDEQMVQRLTSDDPEAMLDSEQELAQEIRSSLGGDAMRCTVIFSLHGGAKFDRRETIAALRAVLPVDLIEDVRIDGRSWEM
jgi:hypothetical protein